MKKAYEFNEEFGKHFYARKCLLRLFRFVVKYLDGDLNKLKDFNFFELKDEEFACKGIQGLDITEIDPDNFEVVNDIYYILWHDRLPDLNRNEIGIGKKYRGDTINTYGTLFCLDSLKSKDLIPVEIQDMVLAFQKKYLTIGNFYLLPNISINGETINKYRGVKSGWRDYFPKFLEELEKVLNNSLGKNEQLFNLVQKNSFYFNKVKTTEEFLNLNFLNDFKNKEKVAKIEKRYCFKHDREKPDYIQFAKDYIEIATGIINSRAEKMLPVLKEEIENLYKEQSELCQIPKNNPFQPQAKTPS